MVTGVSRPVAAELVAGGPGGGRRRRGPPARTTVLCRGLRCSRSSCPAAGDGRPEPEPGVVVEVVHEDEDVMVVDKPAGLVVHPGPGTATGPWSAGCWPGTPSWPSWRRRGLRPRAARASCTGWTGAPRACWRWPAPRPPTAPWTAQLAARTVERRYLALVVGTRVAETRRRSTRPSGARRAPRPGWRSPPRGARPAPRYRVLARCGGPRRRHRWSSSPWRPVAPTRSASTWPPSATRWWATTATAGGRRAAGRSGAGSALPPRRPAGLRPPRDGGAAARSSPLPADLAAALAGPPP